MKAAVVTASGVQVTDVAEPKPGPNEVLVRVRASGLNRADLGVAAGHAHGRMGGAGTILGLEFAGEIVEVGAEVKELRPGDRCSGEGHIVCGYCRNCRAGRRHQCIRSVGLGVNTDGAFADYVVLPVENVWKHPD